MSKEHQVLQRPKTFRQVAAFSSSLEEFGMNLRDWQHEIRRSHIHSRKELARRLEEAPELLADRFENGVIADAYLAAYAEWLADRARIARPDWCRAPERTLQKPWFATPLHGHLLVASPASFRQRNVFTVPEPVFYPHRGRPPVPEQQKREKARLRQKAYRIRINSETNSGHP